MLAKVSIALTMVVRPGLITPLHPRTGLPDKYPYDYERAIVLNDGRTVHVRPIVPGDAVVLANEVKATDPETIYQRFFSPGITFDEERINFLTELDYEKRFAIAAFAEGDGIAIARFEPAGERAAEVAVVVKPDWRRAGLATELFKLLEDAALERDIDQFEAFYLAENHAIERVLVKRGFGNVEIEHGIARVTKTLRPETEHG